jgi:hypothetical protein
MTLSIMTFSKIELSVMMKKHNDKYCYAKVSDGQLR